MAIDQKIRPINENHSIKEAVISVFLASPIIKPERFQKLIETKFEGVFHQFEPLVQFHFQIRGQGSKILNQTVEASEIRGFKFSAFGKGKLEMAMQGLNETNRTYISFHSFNYSRWKDFKSRYINYMSSIIENLGPQYITGVSLHYVDVFNWSNPDLNDIKEIFDIDCVYLSKEIFNSLKSTYLIEKNDEAAGFIDRLEIKIEPNMKPFISISHNITMRLVEVGELQQIVNEQEFDNLLLPAHIHNKKLLKCILNPEIQKMINLQ